MKVRTTLVLLALVIGLGSSLLFLGPKPDLREDMNRQTRIYPSEELRTRGRDLFDVASSIEIDSGAGQIALVRQVHNLDTVWHITKPFNALADPGEVFSLLSELELLRYVSVLRPEHGMPLALESLRLKPAQRAVTFAIGHKMWTLNIGRDAGDQDGVHVARVDDANTAYAVPKMILDRALLTVNDLRDKSVLRFKPRQATRAEIVSESNPSLECRKTAYGWKLLRPIVDEVDTAAMDRLLNAIRKLIIKSGDFIAEHSAADYGLDKPAMKITVFEGDKRHTLTVGSKASGHPGKRYAERKSDGVIFLIAQRALRKLDAAPDILRSSRVLAFSPSAVAGIEIRWAKKKETLRLRRTGTDWLALQRAGTAVAGNKVDRWLRDLNRARIVRWIDNPTPALLAEKALAEPKATVLLKLKRTRHVRELRFGEALGKGGLRFARRGDEGPVLLVRSRIADPIISGPLAFAPKVMLDFRRAEITRLTIERPDYTIALERRVDKWTITRPEQVRANTAAVESLLRELSYVEAVRIVAGNPRNLKPYGLAPPRLKLTAFLKTDAREGQVAKSPLTRTLLIGSKAEGGTAYAMVAGGNYVFLLSRSKVRYLQVDSATLEAKP